ncbi:MAG TPA: protein kinase [Vicinamibacterales bacterium]
MSVVPGTRLGAYEILGSLGAGGMGEVYRARDSKLDREVAIKALPPAFAADAERIARFEREARLLAALNHPSIATIYGLETTGAGQFIVLELVQGGTLAERVRSRPLAVPEALRIARDIADALHAAHERGIVHRDIKPANIALTAGGKPKVLDFGLAKAFAAESSATTIDGGTRPGVVLGTVPYMSPEQARGLAVDKRSDIWSFGCVLFEMLTGRTPFAAGSTSDIVARILSAEPDLTAIPANAPARVRWLLRRCLEKDPERRLHDMADARIELDEALTSSDPANADVVAAAPARGVSRVGTLLPWLVAAGALVTLLAVLRNDREQPANTTGITDLLRLNVPLPPDVRLTMTDPAARFALSPDGRKVVFVGASGSSEPMLWVRSFDSLIAQPIPGTEGSAFPFWAPDSESIAFVGRSGPLARLGTPGVLRTVRLSGGQPVTLSPTASNTSGAWSRDNVVLFTPTGNSPLFKVSASSPSEPVQVTTLDTENGDVQHSYPSFLPDGQHFLFTVIGSRTGANEARGVYVGSLDGVEPRLLIEAGSHGRYANGHVLFLRDATLLAQRIDPETLTLQGEAMPIAQGVQMTARIAGGTGAFSVADSGALLYQTGVGVRSQLQLTDRAGKVLRQLGAPTDHGDVVLSPDGSQLLVSALDPQVGTRDLLMYDIARGTAERFTTSPNDEYAPVWSPSGDRVAFTSAREGSIGIYERPFSSPGAERRVDSGASALGKFAATWGPGGDLLFIAGGRAVARSDIHAVSMDRTEPARPVIETEAIETQVRFSPDGRWIAYTSSGSGSLQVYVQSYPEPGRAERVSVNGGSWPHWSRDSREIFFLRSLPETNTYTVMAAAVAIDGSSLKVDVPRPLFNVRLAPVGRLDAYSYDVLPRNEFIFAAFVEEATSTGLTLLLNWERTVERRP